MASQWTALPGTHGQLGPEWVDDLVGIGNGRAPLKLAQEARGLPGAGGSGEIGSDEAGAWVPGR